MVTKDSLMAFLATIPDVPGDTPVYVQADYWAAPASEVYYDPAYESRGLSNFDHSHEARILITE